jgi:16S rRNA (guanine527-N7)-methyltransferase
VERSAELAATWRLPAGAAEQLEQLVERLSSDPHAPTSVTEPEQVWRVHVADSLLALALDDVRSAGAIVDVGSGAGLPGLPLAAALPGARVDLVESVGRKSEWSAAAAQAMGLRNARAVPERVEDWAAGAGREAYDAALVRAVDSLPVLVEYSAPLLRAGGVLVAWKRNLDPAERERGERAATLLGMSPGDPGSGGDSRLADTGTELITYRRSGPLPPGYPRRPGRARKRPLA